MKTRMMALIAAGALMTAAGCGDSGSAGPAPSPTAADVNLNVRSTFADPNGSVTHCTGRLIWKLEPKNLTGSSGQSDPVTRDRNYDIPPEAGGGGSGFRSCRVTDLSVGNLRSGTWQASASLGGGWQATCQVTLSNGLNVINFTDGRVGCGTGFTFPGN